MTTPRRRRARDPLTAQKIVTVALDIVEGEGLPALTMRRVADDLGVAPMSLYRHVGDRRGLLVAMLDVVALAMPPVPHSEPREEVVQILSRLHETFRAHSWVVSVLSGDGLASSHVMPLMDQLFDCFDRAGLDPLAAIRAWQVLFYYLAGESIFAHVGAVAQSREVFRSVDPAELPAIGRLHDFAGRREEQADFAHNLACLVDLLLPGS